jgi:squalene cyclase
LTNKPDLLYDVKSFILENGDVADRIQLMAAGFDFDENEIKDSITKLETYVNPDGGLPFDLEQGNPSSVKTTSEILGFIMELDLNSELDFVHGMVEFLVSRQKKDGGFAETLNLDMPIEDKYGSGGGREWYPVAKSVTWLTGKALEALCKADFEGTERLRRARDFLLYSQYEDGHWPDFKGRETSDPLGTGNILPALSEVGVSEDNDVYEDGRAALLHHLMTAIEQANAFDMVDLIAIGAPKNKKEEKLMEDGLELIKASQNPDGGWSLPGFKKSDPELTASLAYAFEKCSE